MPALILDFGFCHRSLLTTIMVDHYPLFEFLDFNMQQKKSKMFIMHDYNDFFMCIKKALANKL